MSEPLQNLSIYSITHLVSHTSSAPHFSFLHLFILVTAHILDEHIISITFSLCLSSIIILQVSNPYVSVGTTTLSYYSLFTPKLTLLTLKIIFISPKIFGLSTTLILTSSRRSQSQLKQLSKHLKDLAAWMNSSVISTPSLLTTIILLFSNKT